MNVNSIVKGLFKNNKGYIILFLVIFIYLTLFIISVFLTSNERGGGDPDYYYTNRIFACQILIIPTILSFIGIIISIIYSKHKKFVVINQKSPSRNQKNISDHQFLFLIIILFVCNIILIGWALLDLYLFSGDELYSFIWYNIYASFLTIPLFFSLLGMWFGINEFINSYYSSFNIPKIKIYKKKVVCFGIICILLISFYLPIYYIFFTVNVTDAYCVNQNKLIENDNIENYDFINNVTFFFTIENNRLTLVKLFYKYRLDDPVGSPVSNGEGEITLSPREKKIIELEVGNDTYDSRFFVMHIEVFDGDILVGSYNGQKSTYKYSYENLPPQLNSEGQVYLNKHLTYMIIPLIIIIILSIIIGIIQWKKGKNKIFY